MRFSMRFEAGQEILLHSEETVQGRRVHFISVYSQGFVNDLGDVPNVPQPSPDLEGDRLGEWIAEEHAKFLNNLLKPHRLTAIPFTESLPIYLTVVRLQ